MSDNLETLAKEIWETSRRDEGTISAMGAKIIASNLMPSFEERFWKGYEEAIDAMKNRVDLLRATVDSHSKPHDIFLDFDNELKELRAIHAPTEF